MEGRFRAASRHVREGRARISKQYELIEKLHLDGRPTKEAELVLESFLKTQREFEAHCRKLLDHAQERLRTGGCEDPGGDWPRDGINLPRILHDALQEESATSATATSWGERFIWNPVGSLRILAGS